MVERLLKQGQGWRIGWHPQGKIYKGLVGNEEWAMELTEAELRDFCRLLSQLADMMAQMQGELMDSEKIACEAESDLLWMEVEGFPDAYCLRLILHQERRCEGYWAPEAVRHLVNAISQLEVL